MVSEEPLAGVDSTDWVGSGTARSPAPKQEGHSDSRMNRQTNRPRPSRQEAAHPPDSFFSGLCVSRLSRLCVSPRPLLSVSTPWCLGQTHLSLTCVSQTESQTDTQAPSTFLDICCPLPGGRGWQRASAWSTDLEPHGGPYQTPKQSGLEVHRGKSNCPGGREGA